jgi:glycosidase
MRMTLDGEWLFKIDKAQEGIAQQWYNPALDRSAWQRVQVPRFWEGYPGLAHYDGWGWFARSIRLESLAEPMSLHFAGVDDDAVVWVNGVEVGSHTGYSDPFAVDVSKALKVGENLVVVLVKDYAGGGGIYKPITLIATKNLDELLKSPYYGTPARPSADWVKEACIYSVYLRSASKEGTFAGLEKRIPELKAMGVTVLWLLPIHPIGIKHRKGRLGSPYAVKDYYGINPEFGTMKDFKKLLATAHKNDMKVIIDLVANHTSWDSRLMKEHPDWFTRDEKGRIVAPNADWTDVADLDYSKPALRRYMIDMMKWWVRDVGIDGFRCDVAELVPTDFWNEARRELDTIKPVMMLSEGSIPEHHVQAFDLTYSWNVYDALEVLLKGKRPVSLLDQILKTEQMQFPVGSLRMRFTTNHDKNAWDAPAVTKFGLDGLKLATVLINTLPGVPMIYTGEEVANDRKLDLFDKVEVDWTRPREVGEIFGTLFTLRRKNKALAHGSMIRLESTFEDEVYAFARVAGDDAIIVVLNFGAEARFARIQVPIEKVFGSQKTVLAQDVFDGQQIELSVERGQQIVAALEPRAYKVFVVEK